MYIDARTIPAGQTIEADVCIIGGGAAGITIARELIQASVRVVLLESGGMEFAADVQRLSEGELAGHPYSPLVSTRLRYFGGSTNHWAGACRPLDTIDFEAREWIPHSGWPISKAQLDPYYSRAQEICGLGPYLYDAKDWQRPGALPLPFANAEMLTTFYQFSKKRRFGEVYRQALANAAQVHVYLNATALELESVAAPAASVRRVRVGGLTGTRFDLTAKYFVLATGGIENARLLLLSNKVQHSGLGNQNDLVGRFFMEHPHVYSGVYLPSKEKPSLELYRQQDYRNVMMQAVLALSPETMRKEQLLGFSASLQPFELAGAESLDYLKEAVSKGQMPKNILRHLKQIISDSGELAGDAYRRIVGKEDPRFGTYALHNRTEQAPNPDSRITLSTERDALGQAKAKLVWRLSSIDKRSIRRSHEILARALGQANLGRLKIELDGQEDSWPANLTGGSHHMGTTRMHTDPRHGVVDRNCRAHDVRNLYVAGSSTFPTGGFSNPTLTIVAMSLRLADHLREVLKQR